MKKIAMIGICTAALCLFSACAPKAPPLQLPAAGEITSIEIPKGIEDVIITDAVQIQAFVEKLLKAKPTAKQSTNDMPQTADFVRVDLVSQGDITSVFVYQEKEQWYIEQPYQGIYKTDAAIENFLQ